MGVDDIYSSDITGDESILNNQGQDISGVTTRASTPQNRTNVIYNKGMESLTSKLENIKLAHRTMMDSSIGVIASMNATAATGASQLNDVQSGKSRLTIKCTLPTAQDMMHYTHTPSKNSISSTSTTTGSPEK